MGPEHIHIQIVQRRGSILNPADPHDFVISKNHKAYGECVNISTEFGRTLLVNLLKTDLQYWPVIDSSGNDVVAGLLQQAIDDIKSEKFDEHSLEDKVHKIEIFPARSNNIVSAVSQKCDAQITYFYNITTPFGRMKLWQDIFNDWDNQSSTSDDSFQFINHLGKETWDRLKKDDYGRAYNLLGKRYVDELLNQDSLRLYIAGCYNNGTYDDKKITIGIIKDDIATELRNLRDQRVLVDEIWFSSELGHAPVILDDVLTQFKKQLSYRLKGRNQFLRFVYRAKEFIYGICYQSAFNCEWYMYQLEKDGTIYHARRFNVEDFDTDCTYSDRVILKEGKAYEPSINLHGLDDDFDYSNGADPYSINPNGLDSGGWK